MFEALKRSLRVRSLSKLTAAKTGIVPLSGLSSAVIVYDSLESGSGDAAGRLASFLSSEGIEAQLYAIVPGNLNFYGKIKKKAPQVPESDLFVSLVSGENFAGEFEARRSRARFKVGCRQIEGGVFDLVVAMPVWREAVPDDSVGKIEEILRKIR